MSDKIAKTEKAQRLSHNLNIQQLFSDDFLILKIFLGNTYKIFEFFQHYYCVVVVLEARSRYCSNCCLLGPTLLLVG